MSDRGYFITVEGGDGSGKTTHLPLLVDWLRGVTTREVVTTREPGGTPLGEQLRELVLHGGAVTARAEALLYAADRAQHVDEFLLPALNRGAVVVADRFVDSSIAYQVEGRGLAVDDVVAINQFATGGLTPHLTLVLDVAVEVAAQRRGDEPDRIESESLDFHRRVRARYLALAAADPERYRVIDTGGPIGEAHAQACQAVGELLELATP